MATESTAIVNLVDLMKQKPVPASTGDDELFGGMARFDPMAMPTVAAPISLPSPLPIDQRVRISPPLGDRRDQEDPRRALVKKLALPTVLFAAAMVLLSVYLAKGDDAPKAAPKVTVVQAPPPVVQPIEAPVVQPIEAATEAPADEAKTIEAKPTFEPTVPEPTVPEVSAEPV